MAADHLGRRRPRAAVRHRRRRRWSCCARSATGWRSTAGPGGAPRSRRSLEPLGFLAAMGLGLGLLVDDGAGADALDGVSYLEFIAPGLLAASAMQTAAFESTYPVMGAIKWNRQYHAQLATPLRVVDVLAGHLLFVVLRLFDHRHGVPRHHGGVRRVASPWAVLCIPVGVAHRARLRAGHLRVRRDPGERQRVRDAVPVRHRADVPVLRHVLPGLPAARLARAGGLGDPLWHGVDLCRELALGDAVGCGSAAGARRRTCRCGPSSASSWRCATFERRLVT